MAARKKVEQELTREAIIKEAVVQFQTQSVEQISMRAIASALGVSHGAIYYHFANKAELFNAIIAHYFKQLEKLITHALQLEGTGEERIKQLFLDYIQFGLDHQPQYQYMFEQKSSEQDPLHLQASSECFSHFAQALSQLHNSPLKIFSIHASFISLHGFVSHYSGRVESFEQVKDTAELYAKYAYKALMNS